MGTVTWDPAAFRRANMVGREGSLVELQADGDTDLGTALEALAEAVDVANELLAAKVEAGLELYGLVSSDRARRSPIHPVDDETLARARADFGDAIMTVETLEQDPFVQPS
jgi:hypothetical protein